VVRIYTAYIRIKGARIAAGYGLDDGWVGVRVPVGSRFVFSPRRPELFWGQPGLLFNGYPKLLFPGVKWPGPAEIKKT
jgi:hypothetical protein